MARDNPTLLRKFGQVLRKHRNASGMSQAELAEAAGLTPAYISQLERGLYSVSVTALLELAGALGTTASILIQEVESKLR